MNFGVNISVLPSPRCPRCHNPLPLGSPAGHCPRCLLKTALADLTEPPSDEVETPWTTFGGLELFEEIGRGGMGVVYRARQSGLDRTVAVKVLLRAKFASAEERERFHREAQAAARMKHPGIVGVLDVGEDEGLPWFSMELVAGKSLEQIVREHPMGAREAALCVQHVAQAIQHAHEHGVLHRDLKPSNILMDMDGSPRITDFGIARIIGTDTATNQNTQLTRTGQSLGSPGYAAPEQALHGQADARTDVYGLGALLYHLLAGRPPFQGPTLDAILMQVRENDPISPRRLNPTVPCDLETICLKCLRKQPGSRYTTATDLADDLADFLQSRPIRARPLSMAGRLWRWARRHPGIAALLTLLAIMVAGLVSAALAFGKHEQRQQQRTQLLADARQLLLEATADARSRSLKALQAAWAIQPSADLRAEAIAALSLHEMHLEATLASSHPRAQPPPSMGGSADGRYTLHFDGDAIIVIEAATHKEHARIAGFATRPRAQLDDHGKRIAIAPKVAWGQPCEVTLRALPSGEVLHTLPQPHAVTCLDWAGEFLACGGSLDRLVHVWDTLSGTRLHRFSGHDSELEAVCFRRDGQELVTLAVDSKVFLWHAGTGAELLRLEQTPMHRAPAWWNDDGTRMYCPRIDGKGVDVHRLDWSRIVQVLSPGKDEPRSENIISIHADTTGSLAAAVDETGCHVWDWQHGRLIAIHPKLGSEWMAAQLNQHTGLWLNGWNDGLRHHPIQRDAQGWATVLPQQSSHLGSGPLLAAQRADGQCFASTQNGSTDAEDLVEVWWPQEQRRLTLPQIDPYTAALSPDGAWCVTSSFKDQLYAQLWHLPGGKLKQRLPHYGVVLGMKFTDTGRRLWLWGDRAVQCIDTKTWRPIQPEIKRLLQAFTVNADGKIAASIARDAVILHGTNDLAEVRRLPVPTAAGIVGAGYLTFSDDGSALFLHTALGAVVRWDLQAISEELTKLGMGGH